jgi:hypothetical protein
VVGLPHALVLHSRSELRSTEGFPCFLNTVNKFIMQGCPLCSSGALMKASAPAFVSPLSSEDEHLEKQVLAAALHLKEHGWAVVDNVLTRQAPVPPTCLAKGVPGFA